MRVVKLDNPKAHLCVHFVEVHAMGQKFHNWKFYHTEFEKKNTIDIIVNVKGLSLCLNRWLGFKGFLYLNVADVVIKINFES